MTPQLVDPPTTLWRIARSSKELEFSEISALTAAMPTVGNRFDVPGGGVLYCSSERRGCYAEVLARHRPAAAVAAIAKLDAGFMLPGGVAEAWRDQRRICEIEIDRPLPFVDIEHEFTRAWLQDERPDILAAHGVRELDISAVRGNNRLLTRALAHHIYVANVDGNPTYSGIRYVSRHGDYECWAIFDGNDVSIGAASHISRTDPDLEYVARLWGLTLHGAP